MILWIGRLSYGALFPSLVSAFVGHQVAANLGIAYLSPVSPSVPSLNIPFFLSVGLAGVTFGVASFIFVEIMGLGKRLAILTKTSSVLTGVIGGLILIAVTFLLSFALFVQTTTFFGTAWAGPIIFSTVSQALKGDDLPWYAFAVKAVTTSVTLNFGGSGGSEVFLFFLILPLPLFLRGCPGIGLGPWLGDGSRHLCRTGTRQRVGRRHQYSHRRHCPGHGLNCSAPPLRRTRPRVVP